MLRWGAGARLPSNLGNLGNFAPAPFARRLVYLLETKIARLLAILPLPPAPFARRLVYLLETKIARLLDCLHLAPPPCPTCSPTSLPFGDQD